MTSQFIALVAVHPYGVAVLEKGPHHDRVARSRYGPPEKVSRTGIGSFEIRFLGHTRNKRRTDQPNGPIIDPLHKGFRWPGSQVCCHPGPKKSELDYFAV